MGSESCERSFNKGPGHRIPEAMKKIGSCKASGSGNNPEDSRATQTIQSLVLGFLRGVFEAMGESTARGFGWRCSFSALEISQCLGLSQRQVSNAIFRLKHRRHDIWYYAKAGGSFYQFVIPEILFRRAESCDCGQTEKV